jgi:hypothetical protein
MKKQIIQIIIIIALSFSTKQINALNLKQDVTHLQHEGISLHRSSKTDGGYIPSFSLKDVRIKTVQTPVSTDVKNPSKTIVKYLLSKIRNKMRKFKEG